MKHEASSSSETQPIHETDLRRIAQVNDVFRLAWQSGQPRQIEELLPSIPEVLRPAAFVTLLQVEFQFRRAAGEVISKNDYVLRFPEYARAISGLMESTDQADLVVDRDETRIDGYNLVDTKQSAETSPVENREKNRESGRFSRSIPEEFGRYQILRELGRGGMGAVYLAVDRHLGRQVALKIPIFRDEDGKDAIERFYREARTMATVQHANLCPVFDVGLFEKWHFLTMAYLDGKPMSEKLKEDGAFPLARGVLLLRTIALAVQKAHEAGIVHRDLKPANIMLTRGDEPVIMDFGLASRRQSGEVDLTHTGTVFGSPAYMAPEQVEARHDEIGPATDIYALGVILYQAVTGRRPFEGSVASVFGQIVSQVPRLPSRINPELPLEIDSICLKALAKIPAERHASSAQFAEELSRLLPLLKPSQGTETATLTYRPPADSDVEIPVKKENEANSISRSRRDAELRHVTVAVFGYETDDDSLDPSISSHSEQLHEQSRLFASSIADQVGRFGGVIVQVSGGEVITCFGFPQAYEDAPQRAIRAAFQILRQRETEPQERSNLPRANQVWVALHSGEAVAEEIVGARGHVEISLVGDARNLALRMNAVAEPGAILISSATHQRVGLYFECESIGLQRIRGVPQPVELFKVIRESSSRNRVELADPGNLTPLVGRDTELSILKDRWEQALDGLGQIVLLIGDAGLGKSRLIRELREHVIGDDLEGASVIEWRCSQYHMGTSFFPVAEFFSRLLNFENRTPSERLDGVIGYLRELKIESAQNVSLLCGMLSVPTDERYPALTLSPQKMKELTEELLQQWLQQLAEVAPVLFIVEDLHWLDPSTLELLEKHVLEFQVGRMLSVLTFRPEFETPWKSKPHQTQIALNRLTKRQIGEMMRKRTKRREIPGPIIQQVIERTDGIPLFVEEFTVMIVESGILDRADAGTDSATLLNVIPATLHDLLLSRLDRMAADREVIQLAATIGREFGFGLLAAACNVPETQLQSELDKLVKAEILFQKGESHEASYIFKHALLQDAAYRSMLTKRRQACHQRIAEVLESRFDDIVATQPALLAHHFSEAGVFNKGIQYWLKAGQESQQQSANIEAISHLTSGLKLLQSLHDSTERDQFELALQSTLFPVLMAARGWSAPEVGSVIERAQELCSKYGSVADQFFVMWGMWGWRIIRADMDICRGIAREMMTLVEQSPEARLLLPEACWAVGASEYYQGDFRTGLEVLEQGRRLSDIEQARVYALKTGQHCGVMCSSHTALALWELGYPTQAVQRADETVRLGRHVAHPFSYAMALFFGRQVLQFCGRDDDAKLRIAEEYTICHEQGFVFFEIHAIFGRGEYLLKEGKIDEARKLLDQGVQMLKGTGANLSMDYPYRNLAEAYLSQGLPDDAHEWLERGFDLVHNHQLRGMESEFLRLKGGLALARDDERGAEKCYLDAIQVSRQQQAKSWELRSAISLAELRRRQGRSTEIPPLLQPLYNWFTEGFDSADLKQAKSLLDQLGGSE